MLCLNATHLLRSQIEAMGINIAEILFQQHARLMHIGPYHWAIVREMFPQHLFSRFHVDFHWPARSTRQTCDFETYS